MTNLIHTARSRRRSLFFLAACLSIGVLTLAASNLTHAQQPPARPRQVCQAALSIDNAVSPCRTITLHSPVKPGAKLGDPCPAKLQWLGPEVGMTGIVTALIAR